jgi:hypothetical protein
LVKLLPLEGEARKREKVHPDAAGVRDLEDRQRSGDGFFFW